MPNGPHHIVIGIVYNNSRDRILISRRDVDSHQGRLWEFPGGKVRQGESEWQALTRELLEEVNISANRGHRLVQITHEYPDVKLLLDVWMIDEWSGQYADNEGQLAEFVSYQELISRQFPPANAKVLRLIHLPFLYLITPDLIRYDEDFLRMITRMIDSGLALIQFRSKKSPPNEQYSLVQRLIEICNNGNCELLFNGTADEALKLGTHGVHLTSEKLMQLDSRPLPDNCLVAASCHNETEMMHACNIGLDFCVLGSVYDSNTEPFKSGMGWEQFQSLIMKSTIPVYALGGMNVSDLDIVQQHGAHGVAMIKGVWDNNDPLAVVRSLSRQS